MRRQRTGEFEIARGVRVEPGRIRRWVEVPEDEGRYFEETDMLLIEFRDAPVVETRDLDEYTILDAAPLRERGSREPRLETPSTLIAPFCPIGL